MSQSIDIYLTYCVTHDFVKFNGKTKVSRDFRSGKEKIECGL